MNSSTKIHFLGAAGTVTGSKYLLDTGKHQILIDCGLFQGLKELRNLNWDFFPVPAPNIDLVLLTHGHLDHVGFLPRLVKMGFKRAIMSTESTLQVASVILKDSAKIQEEDAARANKEGYSSHNPAKPLYTVKDAEEAIEHFKIIETNRWFEPLEGVKVRFQPNGHIIGSCFIEIEVNGEMFVFSGDIGRQNDLLLPPPRKPQKADYLFIESTYGNRVHIQEDAYERLKTVVNETVLGGGSLVIPSFAVERSQLLMFMLWKMKENKEIPNIPMILDSPMADKVLDVFEDHPEDHFIEKRDFVSMKGAFHVVEEYKESLEWMNDTNPKIVIAGSGMMNGGRVLGYLQNLITKRETGLLLVGFQAEGTRGRDVLEGAESIKFFGKDYRVRAKVHKIMSLSAHADQTGLLKWVDELETAPKKTFIIHGEPTAAEGLKEKLDEKGWNVMIPKLYEIIN